MKKILGFLRKNWIMILALVIYITLTFSIAMQHTSNWDESHAWVLSQSMNLNNFSEILGSEGHPIIWFLLIMPFAKFNLWYPYPMYILNYIFCLGAIIILWLKSPFNCFVKIAITFSSMFILIFPIFARNYTIGILILFILLTLYKKQVDKPLLYSCLVALGIHTHILITIGIVSLGFIFFFKILKEKVCLKTKINSILIMISSSVLFLLPYVGNFSNEQNYIWAPPGIYRMLVWFLSYGNGFLLLFYIVAFIIFFIKNNDFYSKFYLFFTSFAIIALFHFFYSGTPHHYIILLLYLIVSYWIANIETESKNRINNFVMYIPLMLALFFPLNSAISKYYYVPNVRPLINFINQNKELAGKKLYIAANSRYILPYISSTMQAYDLCSSKPYNWRTYTKLCEFQDNTVNIEPDSYVLTKDTYEEDYLVKSYRGMNLYKFK